MRKNKTTVQYHVFMTKFLPIEQHLSQLTLNICYKHIQIGVISLYFKCISSKQQLYILGFYWFCNSCTRCDTPATFCIDWLASLWLASLSFNTHEGEKCRRHTVISPNWFVSTSLTFWKIISRRPVTYGRMFCLYRRAEMKQRHQEIRQKYGELFSLLVCVCQQSATYTASKLWLTLQNKMWLFLHL